MQKQVLIVEDSETNRVLLHDLLEKVCECNVSVAVNGKQGVDMAFENMPDLILMDVGLPIMDGLEATRTLKADSRTVEIPVLALTGFVTQEDETRMLQAGFDGVLPKPFDVPKLLEKVSQYLKARSGIQV